MATIAVTPFVLKDCVLSIEADDYAAAVSTLTLTPTTQMVSFVGLKPGAISTDATEPTWTLGLTYAQDWVSADSLSRYLFDNQGLAKDAVIKPQSGVGPSFAVEIIITPGAIGGTGQQTATATVTLGVNGQPTLVPAV